MSVLSIDFETRATVNLLTSGVYPYAEHHDTDVWCMAWAFDDEEPAIWAPNRGSDDCPPLCRYCERTGGSHCNGCGAPMSVLPMRVVDHILAGGEMRAHNASFERIIWQHVMVKRYEAPPVQLEQWVCSAAEAAAMALPRHLEGLAKALKLPVEKDMAGNRIMLQLTKPRDILPDGTIVWWDEVGCRVLAERKRWTARTLEKELAAVREKHEHLHRYCKDDVRVEQAASKLLRPLTPAEREVWLMDQRINDRGIQIDRPLIVAAKEMAAVGVARANERVAELTNGDVTKVTNHARLAAWVREAGVETAGVSKKHVRELLEQNDLPSAVRAVLEDRADAGRSSVAKLDSLLAYACSDDRIRGTLFYHAASTGRWGGRGPQPHNFPRPEYEDPESLIPLILQGDHDMLDLIYSPVGAVVDCLRSCMTAGPGMELVAADYSAIEARVLNWLAGQEDILALFASGQDVYKYNAAKLYNIPLGEVLKFPHRQVGKFQELGCGFGMGAKKAVTAAKDVYGLTVTPEQAKEIVDGYRATHNRVVAWWYALERAAMDAVRAPGTPQDVRPRQNGPRVRYVQSGAYLICILPSGRPLYYAAPRILELPVAWATQEEIVAGTAETKDTLTFFGVNPFTKQWGMQRTYGGHLAENVVQAASRDLMAEGMQRAEQRGYTPILSVHDEVVTEVPAGWGSVEEFERLMAETPAWAEGCPVAAEGWRGFRYRK